MPVHRVTMPQFDAGATLATICEDLEKHGEVVTNIAAAGGEWVLITAKKPARRETRS